MSTFKNAFLFTGQGAEYANMSLDLYSTNALYQSEFDRCATFLYSEEKIDLEHIFFSSNAEVALKNTANAQIALFVLEYALAKSLIASNVEPDYLMGHSIGEYVAATIAGCLELDEALKLVAIRGKITDEAPPGLMLAVAMDDLTLIQFISDHHLSIDIAGINGPNQTVLSGETDEMQKAYEILKSHQVKVKLLDVVHGYHSRAVDTVLSKFKDALKQFHFFSPKHYTLVSALTGKVIVEAPTIDYWIDHLRQAVNFYGAVKTLDGLGTQTYIEVGPDSVLLPLVRCCLNAKLHKIYCLYSLKRNTSDKANFINLTQKSLEKEIPLPAFPVESNDMSQKYFSAKAVVLAAASKTLNVAATDIEKSFEEYGGSSIDVADFQFRLFESSGKTVPLTRLLKLTFCELAEHIGQGLAHQVAISRFAQPEKATAYEPFPLNVIQYAYWVGRQGVLPLGHVSSHNYLEVKLEQINIDKLEKSLNYLIDRHPMLRMRVSENGAEQYIQKTVPYFKIPVSDLRKYALKEQCAKLKRVRDELSHQVIPATQWPLFDIRISLSAEKILLHLSFDALIVDMYSMRLFCNEWYQLYISDKHVLPNLVFTYRDYLMAMKRFEKSRLYLAARAYWMRKIKTMPLGPQLPLLTHPDNVVDQKFVRVKTIVPMRIWKQLESKSIENGVTPTSTLLTLFAMVLGRYSLNKDFLINLTLFGRLPIHENVKNMLGDFTNVEVLQCDVKDCHAIPFALLVKRHHSTLLEDLNYSVFNGVYVQRELSKFHQLSADELVAPVVFTSLLNLPAEIGSHSQDKRSSSLMLQFGEVEYDITQTPQVWLDHKTFECAEGLTLEWDYVKGLFDESLLKTMHACYCSLIRKAAEADWSNPLADLITEKFIKPVLLELNANKSLPYSQGKLLDQLIEQQMRASANRIAVFDEKTCLTYRQLEERTRALAAYLQSKGVGKGDYIGISITKSCDLLVAIIALLRCGAIYLPIEVSLPQARRSYFCKDSKTKLILVDDKACLGKNDKEIQWINISRLNLPTLPFRTVEKSGNDIAYLIYTSGSTGRPKGVVVSHGALVNRLLWMRDTFHIDASDRFIQKTPIGFDVSLWEIYLPLMVGASIFMPKQEANQDVVYLQSQIAFHTITRVHFLPSMLNIWLGVIPSQSNAKLLSVFCSGEELLPSHVNQFCEKLPHCDLINLYGPTEATIDVTFWRAPKKAVITVPIGKPVNNVGILVLDRDGLPCPIGVPGELCVSGVQLAQGYLNLSEKTQQVFITNPYQQLNSDQRLYRTGDLVTLEKDGYLYYNGRIDKQIKMLGHRIELGEITTVLEQNSYVERAAVICFCEPDHSKMLIAFIQPDAFPSFKTHRDRLLGTLSDQIAKDRFKLENQDRFKCSVASQNTGLAVNVTIDKEHLFQRKSYRRFCGEKISLVDLVDLFRVHDNFKKHQVSPTVLLNKLFTALSAYQNAGMIFPKYPYPSAGSTYAVKCYFLINTDMGRLKPGIYYFDQVQHQIVFLKPIEKQVIQEGAPFQVILVGHNRCITPLYGGYWTDYAAVEAGAMQFLLDAVAADHEYRLQHVTMDLPTRQLITFEEDDIVYASFKFLPPVNEAKRILPSSLQHWLYLQKPMESLKPGLYYFDGSKFIFKHKWLYPFSFNVDDDSAKIIEASYGIIFITTEVDNIMSKMAAGMRMMQLMQSGLNTCIGLCPMGFCPMPREYSAILGSSVQLSLAFGPISRQQIEASSTSSPNKMPMAFDSSLEEYVKTSTLTKVMYPEKYIRMSTLPTLHNGKIDDQKLSYLAKNHLDQTKSKLVTPKNTLEKSIDAIWCEVLDIPTCACDVPFYSVGGDSLLINQICLKLVEKYDIELRLSDLFRYNTIGQMAKLIESKIVCDS